MISRKDKETGARAIGAAGATLGLAHTAIQRVNLLQSVRQNSLLLVTVIVIGLGEFRTPH
jgi:hypothetical protein